MVFFRFYVPLPGRQANDKLCRTCQSSRNICTDGKAMDKNFRSGRNNLPASAVYSAGSKIYSKSAEAVLFDTGLAAYLTRWLNADALEAGAASSEFFETWVATEIYKSYTNKGIVPPLYYLRNFNGKEIELIIWQNGTAYPVAIKKSAYPSKAVKTFAILEPVSADAKINIGAGGIVCLIDDLIPAADSLYYIPAWVL